MQNNVQAGGAQSPELSGLLSLLLQHLSQVHRASSIELCPDSFIVDVVSD